METSPSIGALMEALAKAQGAMGAPVKNKKNPHFGSVYADHASVVECSKQHLAANKLAITQGSSFDGTAVTITTILGHATGEWIKSTLSLKPDKSTPQGVGSAITYGRRYEHCAMLNMAPDDDDDGNAASPPPQTKKNAPAPEVYSGLERQRLTLNQIFKDLGVDEVGEMVRIANLAKGTPMETLKAFVQGKVNAADK